ncbi:MAG TPA: SigE family RNA polymerase sigma factor [Frankiaceae bacterium]|nr:SigE family RNA polymerase sigma factor [Frankiaceae bacterium]
MDAWDEERFTAFVRARGPALKRTALLLTGDQHAAEDLLQDVLAKAALRWARVAAVDDPEAYVHRMLINAARSLRRRRRAPEPVPGAAPDASGDLADRQAVLAALRALPPRQRAVVVLRHYEDLTEERTAELLGCSVGTVKSQNAKALRKLRAALAADFGVAPAAGGAR